MWDSMASTDAGAPETPKATRDLGGTCFRIIPSSVSVEGRGQRGEDELAWSICGMVGVKD